MIGSIDTVCTRSTGRKLHYVPVSTSLFYVPFSFSELSSIKKFSTFEISCLRFHQIGSLPVVFFLFRDLSFINGPEKDYRLKISRKRFVMADIELNIDGLIQRLLEGTLNILHYVTSIHLSCFMSLH